ncbi:fasciclin domain-containing protein [Sphingomicrobium sp. XHP0239]|uniref:fasciclin domain-containing protein n=1 Tax=Sphingomicrobium maritimum TaxID=3133972 RepID=UPI0031CCAE4C
MTMLKTAAAALAIATMGAPALAADTDHDHDQNAQMSNQTIVEVAAGNEDFSTLVAAVQAAELAGALSGEGPYTVFAPTDAAFNALPAGTVDTLLQPANREMLSNILLYHVVEGDLKASDIVATLRQNGGTASLPTLAENASITAALYDGKVYLSDYKGQSIGVIATDVDASNGTIHVLDKVLMPSS